MGLLEKIFGIRKITPEQRTRLYELKELLMKPPVNNDSIKVYASNLKQYKTVLRAAGGKEAEEYGLMVSVFEGMLQRTQDEIEKKLRVKPR